MDWGAQIIADSNNGVYVTWIEPDRLLAKSNVSFAASTDGGKSFGNAIKLGNPSNHHQGPQLAVSGRNVYLVWTEFIGCNFAEPAPISKCQTDIMFARSSAQGKNFSSARSLAEGNSTFVFGTSNVTASNGHQSCSGYLYCGLPFSPRVDATETNLYLSWMYGTSESYFVRSTDNGSTFSAPRNLSPSVFGKAESDSFSSPFIVAFASPYNHVYFGWVRNHGTGSTLDLIRSPDGGDQVDDISYAVPLGFADESYSITDRFTITQNGTIHFVWSPGPYALSILYESVQDPGTAIPYNPVVIPPNPSVIYSFSGNTTLPWLWYPHLAASDSGKAYVVWQNFTDDQTVPGILQPPLLYRTSTDGGKTFGSISTLQDTIPVPEFGSSISALMAAAIIGVIGSIAIFKRSHQNWIRE